jgi:hypothetical protein
MAWQLPSMRSRRDPLSMGTPCAQGDLRAQQQRAQEAAAAAAQYFEQDDKGGRAGPSAASEWVPPGACMHAHARRTGHLEAPELTPCTCSASMHAGSGRSCRPQLRRSTTQMTTTRMTKTDP